MVLDLLFCGPQEPYGSLLVRAALCHNAVLTEALAAARAFSFPESLARPRAREAFLFLRTGPMPPDRVELPTAGALPLLGVALGGAIIGIAIVAWLVREIASLAIEKSEPDHVADVVSALAALISAFRFFLPWSKAQALTRLPPRHKSRQPLHNELNDELPEGNRDET